MSKIKNLIVGLALVVILAGSAVARVCSVQTYFDAPGKNTIKGVIIQAIDGARTSLDIALHSFTDNQLGDAVARAARRGVRVRAILGVGQDKMIGGEYDKLVAAGIKVAIAGSAAPFRHKFAIIDQQMVITGSYNWSDSASAGRYDNMVLIACSDTAQQFKAEFDRLWQEFSAEEGTTMSGASTAAGVQAVIIYSVNPAGECIQLLDVSTAPVDISGWQLSDLEGSYSFPPDTVLMPNEPYKLCIDTYNPTYDPHGLYLNDDHDEVFLITPEGKIIDERVWGD